MLALTAIVTSLLTASARAQCQSFTLSGAGVSASDQFGADVAASGDVLVVGAPFDEETGAGGNGAVHVFMRNGGTWTQVAKLVDTNPSTGSPDTFGARVAIDGDIIVVGVPLDNAPATDGGSSFVYQLLRGVWTPVAMLVPGDTAGGDFAGSSVAIAGDVIVVGAPGDDDNGADSGSAYVFVRDAAGAWSQAAKLKSGDGTGGDDFGRAVATDGEVVIVGAPKDDDNGTDSGSIYLYFMPMSGWTDATHDLKVKPTFAAGGDRFGQAVALSGTTLVVGAHLANGNWPDQGAAYIFERDQGAMNAWGQVKKLTAPAVEASQNEQFGIDVHVAGDLVAVGCPNDDDLGTDCGSVYLFAREMGGSGAWGKAAKLLASDGELGDMLGASVAVADDVLIGGAPFDNTAGGVDSGTVRIFAIAAAPDCNANGIADACDIATGGSTDADGDGVPDECRSRASCVGDLNADGLVDGADMGLLLAAWGMCAP